MASDKRHEAHVLAIPFWISSHAVPLQQICFKIASMGCKVTYLNYTHCKSPVPIKLNTLELSLLPSPPTFDQSTEVIRKYAQDFQSLGNRIKSTVKALQEEDPGICCILADVYVGWARDVASELGIGHVALWISSSLELAVYTHLLPKLRAQNLYPFNDLDDTADGANKFQAVKASILPGLPPLLQQDLHCFPHRSRHEQETAILHFMGLVERVGEADYLLFNSFPELEEEVLEILSKDLKVMSVGPTCGYLHQQDSAQDEHESLQWLNEQEPRSVAYISFGTSAPISGEAIQEIAEGIEASEVFFLWALSETAQKHLPEGFMDRTGTKGRIYPWVPQQSVLLHASVGGFYTQCGWNSVTEAVFAGVPMLGHPFVSDQFMQCRMVVEVHGVCLREGRNISESLKELIVGEAGASARIKAQQLRDAAKRAITQAGSSQSNLLQLINTFRRWAN